MRHFLLYTFLLLSATGNNMLYAQTSDSVPSRLFRLYEDNDFINIFGKGTDDFYTNGTKLDFFYTKKKKSGFFIDKLMLRAGDSSVNTYGIGITQLMFTPNNIAATEYQPDDYPYAGALIASHSLYSYNPIKKYDFQTELMLGVEGPASLTKQAQTFIHRVINYQKPMGWNNQRKNKLVVNISFAAEKQFAAYNNWFEMVGGAQVFMGSFFKAAVVSPQIRIGKMMPYFSGYISHYAKNKSNTKSTRLQAYLIIKPQAMLVVSNDALQGKMPGESLIGKLSKYTSAGENKSYHEINTLVYALNVSAVMSAGHFSFSFTQNGTTAMLKDLYSHQFGNISFYYSW